MFRTNGSGRRRGEDEVVGDGAVDGVAAAGWFDDLDVLLMIQSPRLHAALGHRADDQHGPGPLFSCNSSPL